MTAPQPGGDGGRNHSELKVGLPFRVVATDLDGTLLRSDLSVSRRTQRALGAVAALGVRHVAVTGRQIGDCRELLGRLGYRGLAVCGQGTQLFDLDTDQLLWSAALDVAEAQNLVARVRADVAGVGVGVASAGRHGRTLVEEGFYRTSTVYCEVVEPDQLWTSGIEKIYLRHRDIPTAVLAARITGICGDAARVTYSQSTVVEILPAGVSKGAALERAADVLAFSAADTIAFGDMPNDIPMLVWAGHSVAMDNADPCVHEVADEIAPSNDNDGVAAVLERTFALDTRALSRP
ncbi:MAG: HAD family hydrolase [Nakamurella sp.]